MGETSLPPKMDGDLRGDDTSEDGSDPGSRTGSRERGRRWVVHILVALTFLGVLSTSLCWWSHYVLLDTDGWVNTVGPLVDDPEITNAVADFATEQLLQVVDVEQLAKENLPANAQFLAVPIAAGARTLVDNGSHRIVNSDQFHDLWYKANRGLHEKLVAFLRGEPGVITATNGQITINFLPVISRVLRKLSEIAPDLFKGRTFPEITVDTPTDQARSELAASLGRSLPENFGEIAVADSTKLASAQKFVTLFDRLVWVLPIVSLGLAAAAVALSRRRLRTVVSIGAVVVGAAALAVALAGAIQDQVVNLVKPGPPQHLATTMLTRLVEELRSVAGLLLFLGIGVAFVGFVLGDSRAAVSIRRGAVGLVRPATAAIRRPGDESGAYEVSPTVVWIGRFAQPLQLGGVGVAAAWALFASPSMRGLLLGLALLAVYEAIIATLAKAATAQ